MRKKKVPQKAQQQPIWTQPDVFFGDKFNEVLGAVQLPSTPDPAAVPASAPAFRHTRKAERAAHADYTVGQAAEAMNLSQDKVRALFRNEQGVKKLTDPDAGKKRKRKYETLRIPPEVFDRVNRRLSVPGKG